MSVRNQALKGVLWNVVERFSTQGIQLILTIAVARILSPADYGLIAMLGVFMAIAQTLVDSGFANALIQKKNITNIDYETAFFCNLLFSLCIYSILYFCAPYIADFYNQPLLTKVMRIYGLTLIINALNIVQRARLTISLDFKKQALASLYAVILSGVFAIYWAYIGWGVWALVGQAILVAFCYSVLLWIYSRWKPTFSFSYPSFKELFSFGSKIMLSGMLHTIYTNMYSLVIGKAFQASTLGYFNRAYTLGQFPVQNFSSIMLKVLYPIQCKYQDDHERFKSLFLAYLRMSTFILFPLMIGLAVLAKPLIGLMLTDKWLPIVPFFQIICIAQMWDPIMKFNVSVLEAKGQGNSRLVSEFIKKGIAFAILFISLPFGINAICWGLVIYAFVDMIIIIGYSRKLMDIGYKEQFLTILSSLILSLVTGGIVSLLLCYLSGWWMQLIIGFLAGTVFYVGISYLLHFKEWKLLKELKLLAVK